MTHRDKINYMDTALQIAGYKLNTEDIDMITSLYDLILEKKGGTDIDSITKIKFDIGQKYLIAEPYKQDKKLL